MPAPTLTFPLEGEGIAAPHERKLATWLHKRDAQGPG